jgi:hypothetical protein
LSSWPAGSPRLPHSWPAGDKHGAATMGRHGATSSERRLGGRAGRRGDGVGMARPAPWRWWPAAGWSAMGWAAVAGVGLANGGLASGWRCRLFKHDFLIFIRLFNGLASGPLSMSACIDFLCHLSAYMWVPLIRFGVNSFSIRD